MNELNIAILLFACAGFVAGILISKSVASRGPIPPLVTWLSIAYINLGLIFYAQESEVLIDALSAIGLNPYIAGYTAMTLLAMASGSALGLTTASFWSNRIFLKPDHE